MSNAIQIIACADASAREVNAEGTSFENLMKQYEDVFSNPAFTALFGRKMGKDFTVTVDPDALTFD